MSIVCQQEQLKYPSYLGDIARQVSVEGKLKLPESYPELDRIIGGDFLAEPPLITVQDNLLIVSGKVHPHLLYLAADRDQHRGRHRENRENERYGQEEDGHAEREDCPHREYGANWPVEEGIEYEEKLEMPGLHPDMVVEVETVPSGCGFEKDGADRVNFHGKLDLIVHAVDYRSMEVVSHVNAQAQEKLDLTKEQVLVEEIQEIKKMMVPIQISLLLPNLKPNVSRILKPTVKPCSFSWEVNRGKIMIRGFLDISLVYVGCDDEERPTDIFVNDWYRETGSAVPFETYVDYNSPDNNLLIVPRVSLAGVSMEMYSHREIRGQVNLECEVKVSTINHQEVVTDLVSRSGELIDTRKDQLNFEEYVGEVTGEINLDLQPDLPPGQGEMERILGYQGMLREFEVSAMEGKIGIEGYLDLRLIYMTIENDSPKMVVTGWERRNGNGLPVTGVLDFAEYRPELLHRTYLSLDSLKAEMMGERTLKLTGTIKARVFTRAPRALFTVRDSAVVIPVDASTRPSMLFYVAQPDDTLWKIARRYQTTVDTLTRANQVADPDRLETGQKLLIPKQVIS